MNETKKIFQNIENILNTVKISKIAERLQINIDNTIENYEKLFRD